MGEEMDMEDMDMEMDGESPPLFWSMKLEPNKPTEIDQPAIPDYIVHVTNACFGVNVNKGSRTLVMVNPSDDNTDTSMEAPVCVLRQGQNENQSLDLLFNESATITVKGQKASTVYLSGYIQPPVDADDASMMNPMMEDMDEAEIEEALKQQRLQQQALDDEQEESEEEAPELMDEDKIEEPPTKKQKTDKGSKATKNGQANKNEKKRKQAAKPVETSTVDDDNKEEEQPKKVKASKKMQSMGKGLKYRDMKIGKGKSVSKGDKVSVFYVGQLDDKKVFDKAISGNGFEFEDGQRKQSNQEWTSKQE